MALKRIGSIPLPAHARPGGFDHAAVHQGTARLYVAHTINDTLDVIDCAHDRYLHSISGLTGVAGALASDEQNLIFTSNRGEDTVGIFQPGNEARLARVKVGVRPNGLAYDPARNLLLAANVGDPAVPGSYTVSIVDVRQQALVAAIPVPGRTRWAIHDPDAQVFYVNIMAPAQIVVIPATDPTRVQRAFDVPVTGPHGLDLDAARGRLFCACDGRALVTLDRLEGQLLNEQPLAGVPDVIFFNAALRHLYVGIGDPGLIQVFDTETLRLLETVGTEQGAHTLGFDAERNKVYAFLPQSCQAAVFVDTN
jgi:DNA-binding beta-propeller fold protein YncE